MMIFDDRLTREQRMSLHLAFHIPIWNEAFFFDEQTIDKKDLNTFLSVIEDALKQMSDGKIKELGTALDEWTALDEQWRKREKSIIAVQNEQKPIMVRLRALIGLSNKALDWMNGYILQIFPKSNQPIVKVLPKKD